MESLDPHPLTGLANQSLNALTHLGCSLVGEGDCQNLRGPKLSVGKHVGDAVGQDLSLTTACSSNDQEGFAAVGDSLTLLRI